ncbi:MAG TPA: YbaN family protein [Prolixibacteraceae bacterium]|nr:YbaN family protein [Prolixibacteraceae bacterium]
MLKLLFILLGTLSLSLGILGIFVPGLPTTPFLLLTAFFYLKGSNKLYNWLINNKLLGKYIKNYQRRKGMTRQQKIYSISLMWIMIILSAGFLVHPLVVRIIILAAGVIGTIVMGFIVPLAKDDAHR